MTSVVHINNVVTARFTAEIESTSLLTMMNIIWHCCGILVILTQKNQSLLAYLFTYWLYHSTIAENVNRYTKNVIEEMAA